jgi:hypothetical protein
VTTTPIGSGNGNGKSAPVSATPAP